MSPVFPTPGSYLEFMHPPRRNGAPERLSSRTADRLTDWLLTHCPLSTLTLLTLLVVGSALGGVPRGWPVILIAVGGRRGNQRDSLAPPDERSGHGQAFRPNVPA